LADEALARLRAQEAEFKRLGVQSLYLFGSRAREDSDVDLFFDYRQTHFRGVASKLTPPPS